MRHELETSPPGRTKNRGTRTPGERRIELSDRCRWRGDTAIEEKVRFVVSDCCSLDYVPLPKRPLTQMSKGEPPMWRSPAWGGLLRWCESDASFRRDLLIRRAARSEMREMFAQDRLPGLTAGEFIRRIPTRGCLRHPDGTPVESEELAEISPDRLRDLLRTSRLVVTGNPMLVESDGPEQEALPGLSGDGLEALRHSLRELLSGPGHAPGRAIEVVADDDSPLTRQLAAHVLSACSRRAVVIHDRTRVAGLHRLGLHIGAGNRWAGVAQSWDRFAEVVADLQSASEGVLRDPLAADLLLCRVARMREPRVWKIAIGLTETRAEAEAIARRCLDDGFAAIAPDNPEDLNIGRLREMVPGDCIVMHLRARIGAIGRVTRPYYEIDRSEAGPLDRCWWRRVGVEWIGGDRDYGELLTGAQQRFSVVELDWECFRSVARMYRRDPAYDRLFRVLHGSWLIQCEDSRFEALEALDKPLPLRDQWSLALGERRPSPGDRVFLYHHSAPRGVFGAGTVISDPQRTPRSESGGYRVDVIYDCLREHPASPQALRNDPRMPDWKPPSSQVSHLSPERTGALSEALELEERRHFVLLSSGCSGNIVRPHETYRVEDGASETTRSLSESTAEGTARCLLYHARPENAFVGFGTVVEIDESPHHLDTNGGSLEVRLDVRRFSRKAGGGAIAAHSSPRPEGCGRDADGLTRTILPVSEHDFYRVVGAGMMGPARGEEVLSLEALAHESGAPLERIEEMERLLRDRGQMILYGPPGTGKTWLALRLATCISEGDETRQEIVQFHPAYSYEDFIEGIRPRAVEGPGGVTSVDYPLVRGSFASFCDRARRDPYNAHVFVVDEINRAQVAAVFGELMLALEYRGREVQLAHGRHAGGEGGGSVLTVPPNVLLIGTMNTADRSTALVDHALRRRFAFYPLFPDDSELVRPMFENWLAEHAPDGAWVVHVLDELNEWLEPEVGRHLLIGHSYFMRPDLDERAVREIWRFQVEPLLAEYFAGVPERLAELDLEDLIWRAREKEARRRRSRSGPAQAHISEGRLWWGGTEDGE